jgi:hypothetical protein
MKFYDLAWAAFCFYYRSSGDKRYRGMMIDQDFLKRLRETPDKVSVIEIEERVVLGLVNMEHYDLLINHKLAETLKHKIIDLKAEIPNLTQISLVDCDINDPATTATFSRTFSAFQINGLWYTGISKIAHVLNDRFFPILSPDLVKYFDISDDPDSLRQWLRTVQEDISEVTQDYKTSGIEGSPEKFLSDKIGYTQEGYQKSIIKFIDEYYWLRYVDCLQLPPRWNPEDWRNSREMLSATSST